METKESLIQYLKKYNKGKKRAESGLELAYFFKGQVDYGQNVDCRSESQLRKIVNSLRRECVLIGSCKEGYYWIITPQEAADTINFLENQYKSRAAAVRGIKKGMAKKWNLRFEL
jgi:hypothetical protein